MPNNFHAIIKKRIPKTTEGYALHLIAQMLVEFKYGEADGLSTDDIKQSFNELRESTKDMPDDLLIYINEAMRLYGKDRLHTRMERNRERLAIAAKYQQSTSNARDAIAMAHAKFKDAKQITVAELYSDAIAHDGVLFAKDFVPNVWEKVVVYREFVHKYIESRQETDDVKYEPVSANADHVFFMNPLAEQAFEYGSADEYAKHPLKYELLSDREVDELYNKFNVDCVLKVGSRFSRYDNGTEVMVDGYYATPNGVIINDGRNQPSCVEELLGVGLCTFVKVEKDNFVPVAGGSLYLEPYAYNYARMCSNSEE